ncbi:uncharacterized protein LOC128957021 [Oppia nitens]|uniref:uncharacterized protein LOC128957021 n=1 Tax=Oppia nitens TaxID=1686743 RepID=UPI0023DBB42C|nr:uncharacterized protein LOC128957021 [Oppia nitens]
MTLLTSTIKMTINTTTITMCTTIIVIAYTVLLATAVQVIDTNNNTDNNVSTANSSNNNSTGSSSSGAYNDVRSCDHQKWLSSGGCEDSVGSYCNTTTNRCECRPDYTISLDGRFCLQRRLNLSDSCILSEQCPIGSLCYYFNTATTSTSIQLSRETVRYWIRPDLPLSPEGQCRCPETHYQTTDGDNGNKVCQKRKLMAEPCSSDYQCIQPDSVCSNSSADTSLGDDGARGGGGQHMRCQCNHTYVFSTIIGHCVKGKYLGESCAGREECQYSEEHSWCIDNICLCGAGYTPDRNSFDGQPQCTIDTMAVEIVVPQRVADGDDDYDSDGDIDYMTLLLAGVFATAFVVAIYVARRNRNYIMQMIRPIVMAGDDLTNGGSSSSGSGNSGDDGHCDPVHHRMIPMDNSADSFTATTDGGDGNDVVKAI